MGRGSLPAVLALCLLFCWIALATAKLGWRRQPAAHTARWGSARRLPNVRTPPRGLPVLNSVLHHGLQQGHRTPWAATGRGGRSMAMAGGGGPWAATGSGGGGGSWTVAGGRGGPWAATGSGGGGGGSWTVAGGGRGGPWAVTSAGGGSQWTVTGGGRHPQHAMNGRTWPSQPTVSARRLPSPVVGTGWAHTGHHGLPDHRSFHPWNFFQHTHHGNGLGNCIDRRNRPAIKPPQWPGQRPTKPKPRPEQRPDQRPMEPEQRPEQRPVEPEQRPEQQPEQQPEQRPVEPEQQPEQRPEQRPDQRPEQRPDQRPEQRPVEPAEEPVVPDQEDGSGFFPATVPEKTDCPDGAVFLDGKCVCRDPTPFLDTILERCVNIEPVIY